MRMPSTARAALALASAALVLTACGGGGGNPLNNGAGPSSGAAAPAGTIIVGSANFTENQILAEIYAQALQSKGVTVEKRLNIGSRETYYPGLQDGSIDLIPEYTGVLLQYFNSGADQTTSDDVYAALKDTLPGNLEVLDKSAAEDKDAVVVTRATATQYNLKTLADLSPQCGNLVFGGAPEFQTRPDGIPGIQKTYNCTFKEYRSLDAGGPLTVAALKNGDVQAANLFTTQSAIQSNDFVALEDPKNNFAAQNVVPLINSAKATDQVKQTLNAISAKLTTAELVELNRQLNAPDKPDSATVAKGWLTKNGLG
jgi:osmoprotectant transport system substrate-binding protein